MICRYNLRPLRAPNRAPGRSLFVALALTLLTRKTTGFRLRLIQELSDGFIVGRTAPGRGTAGQLPLPSPALVFH